MITGFAHQVQLSVFVKAVGMGYFLGIVFFTLMLLTHNYKKGALPIFIRDITFFAASAFLCFVFSLKYCSGMWRFYVSAGELIGFLLFFMFPGRQFGAYQRKIKEQIYFAVKKILKSLKILKKNTKNT